MTRLWMLALMLALALPVQAADSSAVDLASLRTCSSAPVKALKFFEVGEAQLARPDCNVEALLTPPLQLTFAYQRAIPGDAMAKAALVMIERNLSDEQYQTLEARLKQFSSGYRDIEGGDAYHLRYSTDGELELWLNQELLRTERGHDFARAYLSIWFGQQPYSDELKRRLLAAN